MSPQKILESAIFIYEQIPDVGYEADGLKERIDALKAAISRGWQKEIEVAAKDLNDWIEVEICME